MGLSVFMSVFFYDINKIEWVSENRNNTISTQIEVEAEIVFEVEHFEIFLLIFIKCVSIIYSEAQPQPQLQVSLAEIAFLSV